MRLRLSENDPMARGSGEQSEPMQDTPWLYAYSSLVTVLLLFMIVTVTLVGLRDLDKQAVSPAEAALAETHGELQKFISDSGLDDDVAVDSSADRLTIRLGNVLLFRAGQDTLTPRAREVLDEVSLLLAKLGNPIRVEGHTDDIPISTTQFPSNWELSSARAISVVRYLESRGISSGRLSAAGYGEFHGIFPNDTTEHRAKNRRVEILVIGGEQHAAVETTP